LGFNASDGHAQDQSNLRSWLGWILLLVVLFIIFIRSLNKEEPYEEKPLEDEQHDNYVDKYSMEIKWSDEDKAYVVKVPELPGCETHGSTYEEAVQRGEEAIESWIEASRAWGDPIPPPRKLTPA